MIKLTAIGDHQHAKWYFHTKEDASIFKNVFRDHLAYVNWKEEESDYFEEMDSWDTKEMDEDPKTRAEDDLPWAFNSYAMDVKVPLSTEENDLIHRIMVHQCGRR